MLDGGTNDPNNPSTFVAGDLPIVLEDPSQDFYDFDGWDPSDTINAEDDVTVTATWTPIDYNITYDLDGGENDLNNPSTFNADDSFPISLEPATKNGFTFDGWFDQASGGEEITEITSSDLGSTLVLFAQFTEDL